ncbi:unnamed protein product [Vicia faba]|uniref:Uncharacterized protein n=1 Tax=Vicia faba TaxID=3906 RepID=A0AAV0ZN95_VICFA|nr:unnamed protein product [Vicia faba]
MSDLLAESNCKQGHNQIIFHIPSSEFQRLSNPSPNLLDFQSPLLHLSSLLSPESAEGEEKDSKQALESEEKALKGCGESSWCIFQKVWEFSIGIHDLWGTLIHNKLRMKFKLLPRLQFMMFLSLQLRLQKRD